MSKFIDMKEVTSIATSLTDLFAAIALSEPGATFPNGEGINVNKLSKKILYARANAVAEMGLIMLAVMIKKEIISFDSMLEQYPEYMRANIIKIYDVILKQLQLDVPAINLNAVFNPEDKSA